MSDLENQLNFVSRGSTDYNRINKGIYELKKEQFNVSYNNYLDDFIKGKHEIEQHGIMKTLLGQNEKLRVDLETFKSEVLKSTKHYTSNPNYKKIVTELEDLKYQLHPKITDKTGKFLDNINKSEIKEKIKGVKKELKNIEQISTDSLKSFTYDMLDNYQESQRFDDFFRSFKSEQRQEREEEYKKNI